MAMAAEAPNIDATQLVEALDCLRIGLATFDDRDRLTFANQHLVRMFPSIGPDAERLAGMPFSELVMRKAEIGEGGGQGAVHEPEAWLTHRMSFHRSASNLPLTLRLADGRWIEAVEQATPDGGVIVRWSDISELKRGEVQFQGAVANSSDGYALWNAAGRLTNCNRRFAAVVAAENRARLLGLRLPDVFGLGVRNQNFKVEGSIDQWVEDRWADHLKPKSDTVVRTASDRWLRITSCRTRDGGITTVLSDISEQREQQMQFVERGQMLDNACADLRKQSRQFTRQSAELSTARDMAAVADASRTVFLRNMSHELRTPLNSIIGFAEVLDKQLYGPLGSEQYSEYAGMVLSSGHHLLDLVNRILDLSRLETDRYMISPEQVNLKDLIDETVVMMERRAGAKGITIDVSSNIEMASQAVDEAAIRQVMVNLLSNAITFSERGGTIHVTLMTDDSAAVITITDEGIGISRQDLERVMEPFQQAQAAKATGGRGGVGLGLPIAKNLVELHGGTIALHSTPGKGTRVEIRLPRTEIFAESAED